MSDKPTAGAMGGTNNEAGNDGHGAAKAAPKADSKSSGDKRKRDDVAAAAAAAAAGHLQTYSGAPVSVSFSESLLQRDQTYSAQPPPKYAAPRHAAMEDTEMEGVVEDVAMGDGEESEEEEETLMTPAEAKAARSRLALKKANREADNNIGKMPDLPSEEDLLNIMTCCMMKKLHSDLFDNVVDLFRDAAKKEEKKKKILPHSKEGQRLMLYREAKEYFCIGLTCSWFYVLSNTRPKRSTAPVSYRDMDGGDDGDDDDADEDDGTDTDRDGDDGKSGSKRRKSGGGGGGGRKKRSGGGSSGGGGDYGGDDVPAFVGLNLPPWVTPFYKPYEEEYVVSCTDLVFC